MGYTTTDLINDIIMNAHIPQGQTTFDPTKLLRVSDFAMKTIIAPQVASARENYWMTSVSYDVPGSPAQITSYPIPSLAMGSAVVEAKLLVNEVYYPLDRIMVSELVNTQFSPRESFAFYVEDNLIQLLPNSGLPGKLRLWYYREPSQLVLPTTCAQITAVSGNVVTVAAVPATFSTSTMLDISSSQPGFNVIVKDSIPTAISGSNITFSDVPDRVQKGDWVSLTGQSCVVQCPQEWIIVLVQAATCRIYQIQGYDKKLASAQKDLDTMVSQAMKLVSPRFVEKTKVIQGGGQLLKAGPRNWIVGRKS